MGCGRIVCIYNLRLLNNTYKSCVKVLNKAKIFPNLSKRTELLYQRLVMLTLLKRTPDNADVNVYCCGMYVVFGSVKAVHHAYPYI